MMPQLSVHKKNNWKPVLIGLSLVVVLGNTLLVSAQTFDSTSNGSDGALNLTTPGTIEFDPKSFSPPLDADGDNIYHFTTINIGPGVIVRLTGRKINGPVFWLASGAVQIAGTVDLNGGLGQRVDEITNSGSRFPSVAGAGGYPGGVARFGDSLPQPGSGPGGGGISSSEGAGAGHNGTGNCSCGLTQRGQAYGNNFLVPLLGGSGGAGGINGGGGAGGGALLIASSVSITVNGTVMANGGPNSFGNGGGGGGSGGAIRMVVPIITGSGVINALGNPTSAGNGSAAGRIRLEAFQQNFTGSVNPGPVLASPFALFLPTNQPSVRVVSVDGQLVPSNPTGSFTIPDVKINKVTASTVNIAATNVPLGTVVKLHVFSENAPDQTVDSTPLTGSLTASTATATVTLPPGFSRGFVRATWIP